VVVRTEFCEVIAFIDDVWWARWHTSKCEQIWIHMLGVLVKSLACENMIRLVD
jgi:hypothetical protein